MLRNVLVAYLEGIRRERDFDPTFLALLSAVGFRDVHLTHGTMERGKDFIAKSDDGGIQWAFQTKKGDLSLADAREIVPQLYEAATMDLSHPSFDPALPRRVVLVTTGGVGEHANDRFRQLNDRLEREGIERIEIWETQRLANLLLEHGLEGVRGASLSDIEALGRFYTVYGQATRGEATLRDLEEHSRAWYAEGAPGPERLLVGSVEAGILAAKGRENGLLYDAFQCELASLRAAVVHLAREMDGARETELRVLVELQVDVALRAAGEFAQVALGAWEEAERRLDRAIGGPSAIVTYPVHCHRIAECLALLALAGGESGTRAAEDLAEFAAAEPGCAHPISDRYAVSTVLSCLALVRSGRRDLALGLVADSTIWLCDRREHGMGLAQVDASVDEEVAQFLGHALESFALHPESSSFFATALGDLAAFLGDAALYADVVNDLKAVELHPEYFQPQDTVGQFTIEARDIVHYPSSSFLDALPEDPRGYAEHAAHESTYTLAESLGPLPLMLVAALLRDRYFLGAWNLLMPS